MVELEIDALPVDLELELWAHLAAAIGIQLSVDSVHLSVGISSDRADHLGVQGLEELVFFFLENVLLVVRLDLGVPGTELCRGLPVRGCRCLRLGRRILPGKDVCLVCSDLLVETFDLCLAHAAVEGSGFLDHLF